MTPLSRQVFVLCIKRFIRPFRSSNGCLHPGKIPLRCYTAPALEAPFYSRLSSLLKAGHEGAKGGLGISLDDAFYLADSKKDLIQQIGLNNQDGLAPETIADNIINYYRGNCDDRKNVFLSIVANDLGVSHDNVISKAQHLLDLHASHRSDSTLLMSESSLRHSLTPFYNELFSLIARVEGGIKFLVDLRGDLLALIKQKHSQEPGTSVYLLKELSSHLRDILSQWFTPQLMDLQHITWESPCDILEKISDYEAVHRLRHWKDLKHRVGSNRRCFIFTHKAIPREPIVVLHVALTTQTSSSIQELLDRTSQKDTEISNAIFYSISATQKGLSGVELGNFLIRRAVDYLQREFPLQLSNFVTLSPIPGFRRWLDSHLNLHQENDAAHISKEELEEVNKLFPDAKNPLQSFQHAISSPVWGANRDGPVMQALKKPLTSLCARYLALEKRRGNAIDPVAHFHLQNGASIWRVNWLGDTSPKGLERSFGLMVNYRYHLPDMSRNSDMYRINGDIAFSDLVQTHF